MSHIRYNRESETYEREGYEPVPKREVLGYLPTLQQCRDELGRPDHYMPNMKNYRKKILFIQSILSGDFLLGGELGAEYKTGAHKLSKFARRCMYEDFGFLVAILFILSETKPAFVEYYLESQHSRHFREILDSSWIMSHNWPGPTFARWFFMLRKQDRRSRVDYALNMIQYACQHANLLSRLKSGPNGESKTSAFCTLLFDHAEVSDPKNYDDLLSLLNDVDWSLLDSSYYPALRSIFLHECIKYLYGLTLFDRLIFLVKNE